MSKGIIEKKILNNITFGIIATVVANLSSLVIIPFVISVLGTEKYGIWIAIFAFLNYFNLLDFGFGAAGVKYTAEYYARNDVFRIGQVITTSTLFHLMLLPVFFVPIFFRNQIIEFFGISRDILPEAVFVLTGAILIFALSLVFGVFTNVLIGLQRMDITSTCAATYSLLNAAGTVIILKAGLGLRGMIVMIAVLRICLITVQSVLVFKIIPEVKNGLKSFNMKMFYKFFKYGIQLQVAGIAGLINSSLDKLLIGYFLRMELVALYELGSKIATLIKSIPAVLLPPLMPAASELYSLDDEERLRTLYNRGSKYISLLAVPIAFFVITSAPTIMLLWMGTDKYEYSVLSIRILSVGYFFNILPGIVTPIFRGIGRPQYEMQACSFIAIANLVLSTVLILKVGYVGALLGTSLSMSMGYIWYFYKFNKLTKKPFIGFLINILMKPIIGSGLGTIAILMLQNVNLLDTSLWESTRIVYFIFFVIQFIIFILVYIGTLSISKHFDQTDVLVLKNAVKALRREK